MPTSFEMLLKDSDIKEFTEAGHWKNRLLIDYFDEAVANTPDKLAAVERAGRHTYKEMADDVDAAAHGLLELGVQPADVIGIQLPNWYEWVVLHLATIRVGAITNALIPIYRDQQIGYMAKHAEVSVLFIAETFRRFNYMDMIDRLRDDLPDLKHTIVVRPVSDKPRKHFTFFETFMERGRARREANPADFAALRPDPNDLSLIMFTSGTTGKPKGVMHVHNSMIAGAAPWDDNLGLDSDAVIHMASTFGHLTGFLWGVSMPIVLGGTGVFQDVWDVDYFLYLTEKYGVNHTTGAAPFLHDFLNAENFEHYDLSSLKHFVCVGAPIPRSFVTTAEAKLPTMSVFGGWGMTECGMSTMGHPSYPKEKRVATDGYPLAGMCARIVNSGGEPQEPNTEGTLEVTGPLLFRGYLKQLDKTHEEMNGEWFNTGDIATIDEDGFVTLSGRSKDIIIRGGENIPVADVENALVQHPDVADVAVVAMPHDRLQEIAAAVVVPKDPAKPLTMESMQKFLGEKSIAKPYWPEYLQIVEELPRTPSGKAQKFKLREMMAEVAEQNKAGEDTDVIKSAPGTVTGPVQLQSKRGSWWGPVDVTGLDSLFTPEEKNFALTVRKWVDKEIRPNIGQWYNDGQYPRELMRELGKLGVLGMYLKDYGCPGRTAVEYGLAASELEAGDSGIRTVASVQGSLAMAAIRKHGSLDQCAEWLPGMSKGEIIGCFGLTEPTAGSDPSRMLTTAKQDASGDWVLNGTKRWVGMAPIADVAIIWAQTEEIGDGKGVRGFVVPTDTPGFSTSVIEPKLSMRASIQGEISMENVRLPYTAMLPLDSAVGLRGAFACLNDARYSITWGVMGAARDSFNAAREYSLDREQFGYPLASFQFTQAKLAEMAVAVNRGYVMANHLGRIKDTSGTTPEMVSAVKLDNTRTALLVAQQARTIIGGNGITLDYSPMRHAENLESVRTYEGTEEMHQLAVGRAVTGLDAFAPQGAK
ncbi:AMP-binding protein [Corynebacterium sp. S7]